MSMSLTRTDTLPWYKQFWPWFIFGLPGVVVVAALATVYIANRHADDLVVDDYYKEGLAINRRLELQQSAMELGINAKLELNERRVTVHMEGPVNTDELHLAFYHPLESDQDFTLTLQRITASSYQAQLSGAVAPRWHWSLAPHNSTRWRIDGAVTATDFQNGSEG